MGHEISNPISIIAIASTHIQNELKKNSAQSSDVLELNIKKIINSSERIIKILRSLKQSVRNSVHDDTEPVLLNDVFEDTLALLEPFLKYNDIDFKINSTKPLDQIGLLCRPSEIIQVLLNLIKNAIDEQVSKIEKWVCIDIQVEPTTVNIRIIDSGIGISKDLENKIFQPLFSTKEPGKGTGLGLSISKKIIEQHQGKLSLDTSIPNTCFWIQLPAFQDIILDLYQVKNSKAST